MDSRFQVDPSGQIILLERFAPYAGHIRSMESELDIKPILYVLFPDSRSQEYRVRAVSESPGSFTSRLPLCEAWCGLSTSRLSDICGIPDAVFVHKSGFIGGCKTLRGVLRMAQTMLQMATQC